MPIRLLPPSVVNKIAAGEVIERPASVAKELMENALDAAATRIDVSVEQGGSELIRVVDNGGGMAADQLPLAVLAHATSKLAEADDLFRVATLGFRGEALASIAEVSRTLLRSRTAESAAGAEIEVVGGLTTPVVPCGCPVGTQIEIRNLFFNTPVRRKFLKGVQTEIGHISEIFTRLALAHPARHFSLRHNQRTLYDLPPVERWTERIAALCGEEVGGQLIAVDNRDGEIRVSGYVAHPSISRTHNRMQYLFLNGRPIRDKSLQHALGEAYRGILLTGRYPVCFLNLEMPFELVDVNVHPTKLEVRFQDAGRLYSQLLGTLRTKFLTSDLSTRIQMPAGGAADDVAASAHDAAQAEQVRRELVDWAKGRLVAQGVDPAALNAPWSADERAAAPFPGPMLELHTIPGAPPSPTTTPDDEAEPWDEDYARFQAAAERGALDAARFDAGSTIPHTPHAGWTAPARSFQAMQVHNRYVIAESEEGVIVIDQHALHERILYEQLRDKTSQGTVETQHLLVPEPVDLSPAEAAAVLAKQDVLGRLGLRVEAFGGSTVLVTGYPSLLANLNPREILQGVVDQLVAGEKLPERRDLFDELLHMIACKAAIKAGDKLSPDEIMALVEQRHLARDTHHCPHGRPTALVFTREELDKQFMRT